MPGVTGAAGPCTARITAALTQNGVTDSANVVNQAKAFLSLEVNPNTLNSVSANFGGTAPGSASPVPGTFSGTGIDMSAWTEKFNKMGEIGAALDQMEAQAEQLLKSPKKEDQIKGQQMMQAVAQIMEALIKAIQAMGDAAKHAIDSSISH
jgi:hypothetical protein